MTTQRSTLDTESSQPSQSTQSAPVHKSVQDFIDVHHARNQFFDDSFIAKIKERNRKALAELLRYPLPPTKMDLRKEFAECQKANLPDDYTVPLKDGKAYTMADLKRLVPEWSALAERALMESDPALADKLMSREQWNAKSAFEVTFVNATNELKNLKKIKDLPVGMDHYLKWAIEPLKKSIEEVKAVNPPGNALIGYGDRVPLAEALRTAENLENEFIKVLKSKLK
jgi:hypothetical protein